MRDRYHDMDGNRISLDTRILRQVNDPDYLERLRKKEQRERKAQRGFNFLKVVLCIPSAIFVFHFIPVLYRHPIEMLETIGVLAGLAVIVSTIIGFWEEG